MKHLDLCSGIGGFALAARWADFETIGFCDIDPWCRKILRKHWPQLQITEDLKNLNVEKLYGTIDLLTAGYPCQPFSAAGKQKAEKDPRHLWLDVFRIIKQSRPRWIICENVEGHIRLGYDTVHQNLESEDYSVWPFIIPASGIGARHRRNRIWIVAHANCDDRRNGYSSEPQERETRLEYRGRSKRQFEQKSNKIMANSQSGGDGGCGNSNKEKGIFSGENAQSNCGSSDRGNGKITSDPNSARLQEAWAEQSTTRIKQLWQQNYWAVEPNMGRVAHGIPDRVDRIKGLGNAIVPQIAFLIMKTIKEYEHYYLK